MLQLVRRNKIYMENELIIPLWSIKNTPKDGYKYARMNTED